MAVRALLVACAAGLLAAQAQADLGGTVVPKEKIGCTAALGLAFAGPGAAFYPGDGKKLALRAMPERGE